MRSDLADLLRALRDRMSDGDGPPAIGGGGWDRLLAARAELVVSLEVMGHGGLAQRIDRKFSRFRRALAQGRGGAAGDGRAAFELDDSLAELRHLVEATARRLGAGAESSATSPRAGDDEGKLPPPLTAPQITVMRTMAKFDPSQLLSAARLEEEVDPPRRLSEKTIGDAVRRLIELGYAERPEGKRRGVRLTTRGRRILGKIAD